MTVRAWGWRWRNRREVAETLSWISSIALPSDVVLVEGGDRYEFSFPRRNGSLPHRSWGRNIQPTFVIRSGGPALPADEWARIFNVPGFEVLERKTRRVMLPPIRWGVDDSGKKTLLKLARNSLRNALRPRDSMAETLSWPTQFSQRGDVAVALWLDGALRGSMVSVNSTIGDSVRRAATWAAADARFPSLTFEDLSRTRIQITIIPGPQLSLTQSEIAANMGYRLSVARRIGWYLPEVFNVRRFDNLNEFLQSLAVDKAGVSDPGMARRYTKVFSTVDFIEGEDRSEPIALDGPMPQPQSLSPAEQEHRFRLAGEWLCRVQRQDGTMPVAIDPSTGKRRNVDWPRLALSAWSLAAFGSATGEERFIAASRRTLETLLSQRWDDLDDPTTLLVKIYTARLAHTLHDATTARRLAEHVGRAVGDMPFEPILFAQSGSLCRLFPEFADIAERITKKLVIEFRRVRNFSGTSLASWAEAGLLSNAFDSTRKIDILDWIVGMQNQNGSFPEATARPLPYVRGTAKIVESLADSVPAYAGVIQKSLAWLFAMQYTPESMFFVPRSHSEIITGGFRHDAFNQEAWIDGAAHLLLARARLRVS